MAVGLEVRVPILDHRVVEALWALPSNLKIHDGTSKWLLREILYRHVPRELFDRPKQGFAVPVTRWLRGPLRDWAETQLSADRLKREGIFDAATVQKLWSAHLAGRVDHSGALLGHIDVPGMARTHARHYHDPATPVDGAERRALLYYASPPRRPGCARRRI